MYLYNVHSYTYFIVHVVTCKLVPQLSAKVTSAFYTAREKLPFRHKQNDQYFFLKRQPTFSKNQSQLVAHHEDNLEGGMQIGHLSQISGVRDVSFFVP